MSIKKAYNDWAEGYDINSNKPIDLDKKASMETLRKFNFSKVIELGCGTGKNTAFLLEKADEIIALDFSENMLAKAKEKIKDERVVFKKRDITTSWNIKNDFADLVTCSLILEHIKDLNLVFKQVSETLKNDGIFFVSELHPFKQYSGSKARYETEEGTQELETHVHHISEYIAVAEKNGLKLMELKEWFDEDNKSEIPRLIGLVFQN
ncbi:class I SAM-dependent methyltransferase [Cellulophaga baltica]|uniref:class I SAM-dependent DNA methyltransferase n=1 Tax=Cellulophaga baltica TaxID=76594 RepID=UPI00214962FE|nr:class I SAM-dependent methyltransferase [Cellulophaga baltica]MCR1026715.1 class I SAM-dependent methyltransferase [Cellulophaga baltica]